MQSQAHDHSHAHEARPVSRGMRLLLYVLTALTFVAGTQLFVLAEHTAVFFSWAAAPPVGAAFVGAGFWSASAVVLWSARRRDWAQARLIVPTIAVVATMLLVATLQHLDRFQGLFGLAWIEIYALFPPLLGGLVVMQLAVPGRDRHSGARLPRGLRAALAAQALAGVGVGAALYLSPGLAPSVWPWELSELMAKAVGTWLVGTGLTAGVVALVDDRAAMAGNALAQIVFGAGVLFALGRFAGQVDLAAPSAPLLLAYLAATLATGSYAAWLALREGRYAPTGVRGGIPVELRPSSKSDRERHALVPLAGGPNDTRAPNHPPTRVARPGLAQFGEASR
jgi:hypothetical protein